MRFATAWTPKVSSAGTARPDSARFRPSAIFLPAAIPSRRRALLLIVLAAFAPAMGLAATAVEDAWLRRMNVGKAQLENGDYAAAAATFRASIEAQPADPVGLRNLGRALFFDEMFPAAIEVLGQANQAEENSAATAYLIGLAHLRQAAPAAAVAHLERAVRLDAFTAAARYQLAKTYEALGREGEARTQFRETVRLDPQHAAAHFELAMYARKDGDLEGYREALRTYKRLRDAFGDPQTSPLRLEACRHTQAEAPRVETAAVGAAARWEAGSVRFTDVTAATLPRREDRAVTAIAPLEIDARGRTVFVTLSPAGSVALLAWAENRPLQPVGDTLSIGDVGPGALLRVGHFHDSVASADRLKEDLKHRADVLILGGSGTRLLERNDATGFADVTAAAGLSALPGGHDARWLDYEYDGDLDLAVAGETGLSLWQNGGDGRFVEVAAAVGAALPQPARSVAAADLDANGGVDLIVAQAEHTRVFENQRAGRFRAMPEPPGPWAPARQVLVDDLDNDGAPDVALPAVERTRVRLGRPAAGQTIEHGDLVPSHAAFVDFDNDGWLDLCAVGRASSDESVGRIRLWRNRGGTDWSDVTADLALPYDSAAAFRTVLPVDFDADGDSDLLLTTAAHELVVLRNDGGNARSQLKVNLTSLAMQNHGGIGATIEVRAGGILRTRVVSAELPLELGTGGLPRIDSVQIVWPDGTVDNAIDVDPSAPVLAVKRRSAITTGSCPYLYVWDGSDFRFVTDFLGSGALGLALTRDATWPPDPVEFVRVGGHRTVQPREGRYAITITSELREVDYLDALSLVAVDHPPGVDVHPTDSFMPPPVTPSELWAVSDSLPLVRAFDSAHRDVTTKLAQIDGQFALPGNVLPPPLLGVCEPISYVLDFGPIPTHEPLALAVTGLLEFGTASANIALSQTDSASLIWPTLEAETAQGHWVPVAVNVGIPDGRTKTHVCDLAQKLPAGVRRLRLTTSFHIYWDRIALMTRHALPAERVHRRAFERADLGWRGFSRVQLAADGLTRVPMFDAVTDQPPWHTTVEGWCTRYGDVRELLAAPDGMLAVLNGGDALTLECRADAFPPVPDGFERTFFLSAVGWDKEENANTVEGHTVGPLPGQPALTLPAGAALPDDWTQRFNTRWVPRNRFKPAADMFVVPASAGIPPEAGTTNGVISEGESQ